MRSNNTNLLHYLEIVLSIDLFLQLNKHNTPFGSQSINSLCTESNIKRELNFWKYNSFKIVISQMQMFHLCRTVKEVRNRSVTRSQYEQINDDQVATTNKGIQVLHCIIHKKR